MFRWMQSLALAALATGPLFAAEGFRPSLVAPCKKIVAHLRGLKVAEARIEIPVGPPLPLPNADPEKVAAIIGQELHKGGIKTSALARYRLKLDYSRASRDAVGELSPFDFAFTLLDKDKAIPVEGLAGKVSDPFALRWLNGTLPSPLSPTLHDLANEIAAFMDMKNESAIAVREINGPNGDCHGLKKMLRDELTGCKTKKGPVRIEASEALILRGTYRIVRATTAISMKINLEIVGRLGEDLWKKEKTVPMSAGKADPSKDLNGLRTILLLLPTNVTLPPDKSHAGRTEKLIKMIRTPSAHVGKDGWASPDEKSPFAVAIRVARQDPARDDPERPAVRRTEAGRGLRGRRAERAAPSTRRSRCMSIR